MEDDENVSPLLASLRSATTVACILFFGWIFMRSQSTDDATTVKNAVAKPAEAGVQQTANGAHANVDIVDSSSTRPADLSPAISNCTIAGADGATSAVFLSEKRQLVQTVQSLKDQLQKATATIELLESAAATTAAESAGRLADASAKQLEAEAASATTASQVSRLRQEIDAARMIEGELLTLVESLRSQVDVAAAEKREWEQRSAAAASDASTRLQSQADSHSRLERHLQQSLQASQQENASLSESLSVREARISHLESELEGLRSRFEEKEREIDVVEGNRMEMAAVLTATHDALASQRLQYAELNASSAELQSRHAALEGRAAQWAGIEQQLADANSTLRITTDERAALAALVSAQKAAMTDLEDQVKNLRNSLVESNSRAAEATSKVASALMRVEIAQAERTDAVRIASEAEAHASALGLANADLTAQVTTLRDRVTQMRIDMELKDCGAESAADAAIFDADAQLSSASVASQSRAVRTDRDQLHHHAPPPPPLLDRHDPNEHSKAVADGGDNNAAVDDGDGDDALNLSSSPISGDAHTLAAVTTSAPLAAHARGQSNSTSGGGVGSLASTARPAALPRASSARSIHVVPSSPTTSAPPSPPASSSGLSAASNGVLVLTHQNATSPMHPLQGRPPPAAGMPKPQSNNPLFSPIGGATGRGRPSKAVLAMHAPPSPKPGRAAALIRSGFAGATSSPAAFTSASGARRPG